MRINHIIQLLGLLVLLSLFAVILLEVRMLKVGSTFHKAFEWNLFLAWIPLIVAFVLYLLHKKNKLSFFVFTFGFTIWLLFFPNAPYIITDLVHLKVFMVKTFPYWYDVIMIFSFAFSGLLCGLLSLYLIQKLLRKYFHKILTACIILICIFLTGIGIYLGRVLRWNSWDIFNKSKQVSIIQDITNTFLQTNSLAFILVHGVLLLLAYLFFLFLIKIKEE
jgi:uncharacterized membrane protein